MTETAGGETDIAKLIQGMEPKLNDGVYVFVTIPTSDMTDPTIKTPTIDDCVGTFREHEGMTLILLQDIADKYSYSYSYKAAWITLTIHSSLDAVGLTAHFSNVLAKAGISCNVLAGYYHDHIFVDQEQAGKAVTLLTGSKVS